MSVNRPRWLHLILILVVLSRLPLLWDGYGPDGDAWRVAAVAHHLKETGKYVASRLPGYPLHEFVAAPFVLSGGAPLSNATTLGAMLFTVWAWYRFVAGSTAHPAILVTTLAFTPILWTNSAITMDYVWSLLFIILSLSVAQQQRIVRAGIYLGLAAGFRPTNLIALVPIATMAYVSGVSWKRLAVLTYCTLSVFLVAFIPVFVTYGPVSWFKQTLDQVSGIRSGLVERLMLSSYRTTYCIGPLAALAASWVFVLGRYRLRESLRARSPIPVVSLTALFSFGCLFFIFPFEREYLIPAIPFLLLLLDSFCSRSQFVLVTVCLVSFAFVNPDVIKHHGTRGTPHFNVRGGMLSDFFNKKNVINARREELGALNMRGKVMVMTGSGPDTWVENDRLEPDLVSVRRGFPETSSHQKLNPDTHFIDGLSLDELSFVRKDGYTVYCYQPAQEYLEAALGYSMEEMNIPIVPGTF